jgi:hypothetical protein
MFEPMSATQAELSRMEKSDLITEVIFLNYQIARLEHLIAKHNIPTENVVVTS